MKKGCKRIFSVLICAILIMSTFSFLALPGVALGETKVVYIADGGTGDGSSAESPLGNINAAIAAINTAVAADSNITAGKIILAGNVTITTSYTETIHSVPITYTSADKANFKLVFENNFSLRGDVYMTGLQIYINKTTETYLYAYGYKLVMGNKGVANDILVTQLGTQRLSIVGGGNNATVGQINVEINSGTYSLLRVGSGSSGGIVTGDVNWVINGGTFRGSISLGGASASNTINGKTNFTINGGTFYENIYLGCCNVGKISQFDGIATVKISGGTFSKKILPYTAGGTIDFKSGCVIDVSGYTGAADLSTIIDTSADTTNDYKIVDVGLVGVQDSFTSGDTSYSVRFVAVLSKLEHDSAGFDIVANYADGSKEFHAQATQVFSKILGSSATGITQEYTSAQLGGNYIIALSITNIPVSAGTITFTVTPYTIDEGVKVTGRAFDIVYDSGTYVSNAE